jgi:hypothetical protein
MVSFSVGVLRKIVVPDMYKALSIHKIRQNTKMPTLYETLYLENQLEWLNVIFLPKRSPNLNPVETRVNRNMKKDVCANHNYGTEENLTYAVRRYLRCIDSWPKL